MPLTAIQLHDLLQEVTRDDRRAIIESQPGLHWMLPELDAHQDTLGSLLAGRSVDDLIENLRRDVGEADDGHDDAHRFLHGVMDAGLHRGTAEQRTAIALAMDVLYANGLNIVRASYRQEVAETDAFAARLERPEVVAGLEAAGEYVKRIKDVARECVKQGQRLEQALRAVENAEVEASTKPNERALFHARNAALATWSAFVQNVEYVLAGDDPDTIRDRERLLHRWRRIKTDAVSDTPAPVADTDAPVVATPEPV